MPTFAEDLSHIPAVRADLEAIKIYDVNHRHGNPIRFKYVSAYIQGKTGKVKYRVRIKGYTPLGEKCTIDLPGRYDTATQAGLEVIRYLKLIHGERWRRHALDTSPVAMSAIEAFDENEGISSRKKLLCRVWVHGVPHIVTNPRSRQGFSTEKDAIAAGRRWIREQVPLFWHAALTRVRPPWARVQPRRKAMPRTQPRQQMMRTFEDILEESPIAA